MLNHTAPTKAQLQLAFGPGSLNAWECSSSGSHARSPPEKTRLDSAPHKKLTLSILGPLSPKPRHPLISKVQPFSHLLAGENDPYPRKSRKRMKRLIPEPRKPKTSPGKEESLKCVWLSYSYVVTGSLDERVFFQKKIVFSISYYYL